MDGSQTLVRRESADDYPDEICRFDKERIIFCPDRIQWIIQHRVGRGASLRWVAMHYCYTRAALVALWQADDGLSCDTILALPENAGGSL